jgi:hypothetical protein
MLRTGGGGCGENPFRMSRAVQNLNYPSKVLREICFTAQELVVALECITEVLEEAELLAHGIQVVDRERIRE